MYFLSSWRGMRSIRVNMRNAVYVMEEKILLKTWLVLFFEQCMRFSCNLLCLIMLIATNKTFYRSCNVQIAIYMCTSFAMVCNILKLVRENKNGVAGSVRLLQQDQKRVR